MKKFLLGTTAIVTAAAVTAPAVAAEKITLGLGGYMEQYVGFADNETDAGLRDYRSFDVQSDTEVWFQGSTTLDNGLKFAVKIEMEADGEDTDGSIDESYLDISSAQFGALRIGYEDPVTALMHNTSPNYGPGYGDADTWVVPGGITKENDSYVLLGQGDEIKISYFTPRFFGFQAGATYVPELENRRTSGNGSNATAMPNSIDGAGDAWFTALNYTETFGGFGVGADVGYGRTSGPVNNFQNSFATGSTLTDPAATVNQNVKSRDGYQAGLALSYAGFQIGGAWQYSNEVHPATAGGRTGSASNEGSVWEVGAGYKSGPWGVSVGYMVSEQTGSIADPDEDEWKVIAVSGIYNLGPGIDVHGSVYHVDQDDESGTDASHNSGGWAVVAGFKLAF